MSLACAAAALVSTACSIERVASEPSRTISDEPVPAQVIPEEAWPKCAPVAAESDEVFRLLDSSAVHTSLGPEGILPLLVFESIMDARVLVRDALRPEGNGVIAWQTYCTQAGCMSVDPRLVSALAFSFTSWRAEDAPAIPPRLGIDDNLLRSPPRIVPDRGATMTMNFVYQPAKDPATCKGLVVFLPPSTGTEYVAPVLRELLDRNWAVLHKEYGTFRLVSGPLRPQERRDARPDPAAPFELELGDSPSEGEAAASVARTLEGLAHVAYSVEAAVKFVYSEFPKHELASKPLVLLGTSLGAVQGPTVAARLPRLDAAVFVGGGANVLGILASNGVEGLNERIVDGASRRRPVTPRLADKLSDEYLRDAPLDPYNTALCLARRPVLLIHAAFDGRVPAKYGDLLWERLGRPERWVANYGHDLLFFFLGDHSVEIADWIEGQTSAPKHIVTGPQSGGRDGLASR